MGNCGSAKKALKADATKAVQSAATLANNENINPNLPKTGQAILKQDASEINGQSKNKNFKIKFIAVDDSYYPNKKQIIGEIQNNLNPSGTEIAGLPNFYVAEMLLKNCLACIIDDPKRNLKHYTIAKYKNTDLREKMNLKLNEIFKEGDENTEHLISLVYGGLKNLPAKANEFIAINTNYYATINYHNENKKELVVFAKDVSTPDCVKLSKVFENVFDPEMNEIVNEHTTYCNGLDYFYVSGCGDKGLSKSFFRVNLNPKNISNSNPNAKMIQHLADMPVELTLHAMIYVPDSYIFVVGGESKSEKASAKVYFYDIKNKSWDEHSKMNEGRVQHSLCLVNDQYLYAIFGNKNKLNDDVKNMERINLRRAERFWEPIIFDTFDLQFFNIYGVAQYKNSLILLSVDEKMNTVEIEDNNERNLIFNLESKKLHLYSLENLRMIKENKALPPLSFSKKKVDNLDHKLDFLERSFVPVSENILILSPLNHNKNRTNMVIIKDGNATNQPFSHL